MKPANDLKQDYKALVRHGYDQCAEAYERARTGAPPEPLDRVARRLPDGARVLDVGCGSGIPVARALAQRFKVVGVDLSIEQIRRARRNVPSGTFIHSDVMSIAFPNGHFDAAVVFYSLFHLPREEHPLLLRNLRSWLKPEGYLLVSVTPRAEEGYTEDDFFGTTMYWSNYGLADYLKILEETGFRVIDEAVLGSGCGTRQTASDEVHPVILAQALPSERRDGSMAADSRPGGQSEDPGDPGLGRNRALR